MSWIRKSAPDTRTGGDPNPTLQSLDISLIAREREERFAPGYGDPDPETDPSNPHLETGGRGELGAVTQEVTELERSLRPWDPDGFSDRPEIVWHTIDDL